MKNIPFQCGFLCCRNRIFLAATLLWLFVCGVAQASERSDNFLLPLFAGATHAPQATDELPAPAGARLGAPAYAWEVFTPVEISSSPYNKTIRIPIWLRVLASVPATNGWNVNFLAYTLYIDRWTTTYGGPFEPSHTRHEAGRGDAGVQVTFTHDLTERWSAGFGARLQGPTAGPGS